MKTYDVVVIGAGIHGVAAAREALQRGFSILVVEAREAAGLETSSASSKLIHGGLRYLESAQFSLVFECLKERRWLLQEYPDLVSLKTFYIPVYRNSKRSRWTIKAGLFIYWVLSGFQGRFAFKSHSRALAKEMNLAQDQLLGLYHYQDAQTDDKALTQRVLEEVVQLGGEVIVNTPVTDIAVGTPYRLTLSSKEEIQARTIINATGPWVNSVAQLAQPVFPSREFDWVQGTHIVLARKANEGCIYCESPIDGRAVFILPWRGQVMVGTTETLLDTAVAKAQPQEIDYLLQTYNCYFPALACSHTDIAEVISGVRVLPKSDNSFNARVRDTLYAQFPPKIPSYVAIYGGKLTSHRSTAKKTLDMLSDFLTS